MHQTHELGFAPASDWTPVQWHLARERRPNLLIECGAEAVGAVLHSLLESSAGPYSWCRLPGTLDLPEQKGGTLLLENVAALTPAQQLELHDWMTAHRAGMQVVSVTSEALEESVRDGRFLESLFYRLNVVRVQAPQTSTHLAA